MRILMLGWELPPHNCGGLGVACYQMSKALAAHGVDIDFVVPYAAEHPNITHMNRCVGCSVATASLSGGLLSHVHQMPSTLMIG